MTSPMSSFPASSRSINNVYGFGAQQPEFNNPSYSPIRYENIGKNGKYKNETSREELQPEPEYRHRNQRAKSKTRSIEDSGFEEFHHAERRQKKHKRKEESDDEEDFRQQNYLKFIQKNETPRFKETKDFHKSNLAELIYIFLGRVEVLRLSEKAKPRIFEEVDKQTYAENKRLKQECQFLKEKLENTEKEKFGFKNLALENEQLQLLLEKSNYELHRLKNEFAAVKKDDQRESEKMVKKIENDRVIEVPHMANELNAKNNEISNLKNELNKLSEKSKLENVFKNDKNDELNDCKKTISSLNETIENLNNNVLNLKNENQAISKKLESYFNQPQRSNSPGYANTQINFDSFKTENPKFINTYTVEPNEGRSYSAYSNNNRTFTQTLNSKPDDDNNDLISVSSKLGEIKRYNLEERQISPISQHNRSISPSQMSTKSRALNNYENIRSNVSNATRKDLINEVKKMRMQVLSLEEKANDFRV